MFKRCEVVLLPTNKAENALIKAIHLNYYGDRYFTKEYLDSIDSKAYHLYILSDDKVKEGDYFLRTHLMGALIDGVLTKASKFVAEKQSYLGDYIKKIIASTDTSLKIYNPGNRIEASPELFFKSLPSPSQSFIEKYVNEYNKKNYIKEVMVEYNSSDDNMDGYVDMFGGKEIGDTLKVDLKDNTITIRKIKDSWNKKEVEQLCWDAYYEGRISVLKKTIPFNQWLEEKL